LPALASASAPAAWRFPRVHPEGWRFAAIPAGAAVLAGLLGSGPIFWISVALTLAVSMFFRDPDRVTPAGDDVLVAPADGLVIQVLEAEVPRQMIGDGGLAPGRAIRISIFLSVFDVHINRAPLAGTVRRQVYVPGLFLNADLDKASEDNERAYLVIEGLEGTRVGVTQIAGLIARRIVSFVRPGVMLAAGQRFGLIRFGSRTDLWLPAGWEPTVLKGQRVIGGETVMARKTG
jgi:phosphatidylserine decarboxylase